MFRFSEFKGTDDLNNTYTSILLDNPDIVKCFEFPNNYPALLIEKTAKSKDLLVDYIIELGHPNINYETIENWEELIVLVFDGDYHIIESTTTKENRKLAVQKIKKEYKKIIETLKM
ncbi:MAG: hypothetical protein ACTSP9_05045 [Promethearchaeota archaeon]